MAKTERRLAQSAEAPSNRNWLSEISREVRKRPSATILYGVPGIGKTSFAAEYPGVCFLVDSNEDGINELKEVGLVSEEIPIFPPASTWLDVMGMLESLRTGEHSHKALALDALGGMERLCHEEVCRRDYNGEWGEHGFGSYQQGYDVSLADWRHFINALDRLRDEKGMPIILLGHAKISPFKNPEGPDYDRYNVDIHHKTWALTHKWASMVLFANYEVAFSAKDETKAKAKAKGGRTRVIYTERSVSYDAKNRHNLAAEISMGNSGKEAFSNFTTAIKEGRRAGKAVA